MVEQGHEDPLCPWCYGPTERRSVVGLVIPEHLRPGEKNPYAASLGRLGGLKGGPARAQKLSAKRRREIAAKAARARWGKPKR
ncbi:MAG: histone H1 [Acidobacteria bacterium]|nr:MAG: histone H1 [Acidobacteriota bacterium]